METQSKFLSKQYLETRLGEFKEIKRKEVGFCIYESNRVFSRSMYIDFYICGSSGYYYKQHTLRISDHIGKDKSKTQFIIDPQAYMTKKKKQQFVRAVETCLKLAGRRHFYKELEIISKGEQNE